MNTVSILKNALNQLRSGGAVILLDDSDRENEGDLVVAAELITSSMINFMVTHARGLMCLALTAGQVDRLGLPLMVAPEVAGNDTPFTVTIDAAAGIGSGISVSDRAKTIQLALSSAATKADFSSPGHVFPLRAHPDGLAGREGHTEGSVELVRRAGLFPAAVICETLREDGEVARRADLIQFSEQHGFPIVDMAMLMEDVEDVEDESVHTHELDMTGQLCPYPILKAKKELNDMQNGEVLKVICTDPATQADFDNFSVVTGHTLLKTETKDSEYLFWLQCTNR